MTEPAIAETERRTYPRFNPVGLKAKILLDPPVGPAVAGEVIDISYSGIKIKLDEPKADDMDGKVRIELFLPNSGIPFAISGILKHQHNMTEVGLHYVDNPDVISMDSLIFECTKLVKA
jgi:hypothetical protein